MSEDIENLFGTEIWCGRGWHPLLLELGEHLRREFPDCTFSQIKQKAGGLRVYGNPGAAGDVKRWRELIEAAEQRALTICEVCGEAGELGSRQGWWSTLCCAHRRIQGTDPQVFL